MRWAASLSHGEEKQKDVGDERIFLSIGAEQYGAVPRWKINGRQKAAGWEARKEGRSQATEGLLGLVKVTGLGPEPLIN